MQNLLLLVAFVYGKNVESLFEDHHFGDDLMYVDSSATLKAEESEARRLVAGDGGEDDEDDDSAPSSATTYKPNLLWSGIVGIGMIFLPLLEWGLHKYFEAVTDTGSIKTFLEKKWVRPLVYVLSFAFGLLLIFVAPDTAEEDASDELANDEDTVPDVAQSGYVDKLNGFLPMLVIAFIALVSSVIFYFKELDFLKKYDFIPLVIMAVGIVAQLGWSAL